MKYAPHLYVVTLITIVAVEFFGSPDAKMASDMHEEPKIHTKSLEALHFIPINIFD